MIERLESVVVLEETFPIFLRVGLYFFWVEKHQAFTVVGVAVDGMNFKLFQEFRMVLGAYTYSLLQGTLYGCCPKV
jgi:hypothetical protein